MVLQDLSPGLKLIILMNSQAEAILFIGSGEWSQKVSNIIVASGSRLEPVVISARNFLATENQELPGGRNLEDFNFIWITTFPDLQLKILEKLQGLNSKIILEKPIAITLEDIQQLCSIIPKMKSSVYLSQPWTFSKLWESASTQIVRNFENLEIHALRVGELERARISPSLDWSPHDLYLLASLMQAKELGIESLKLLSLKGSSKEVLLDYQVGENVRVNLQACKSDSRRAYWRISVDDQNHFEIDFDFRAIKRKEGSDEIIEEFRSDNPIMNMLDNYRTNSSDVSWDLIFRLYSEAIQATSGNR
jgi:predicted dehydrogenase